MKKDFSVGGMTCSRCVDKIEKFVGEIDGVDFVGVDLKNKIVSVEFQNLANEELIIEAILDAGFELDQVKKS